MRLSFFTTEEYRANPVILCERHSSEVIGKGSVKIERGADVGDRLMLSVRWHESELNPLGMLAAEQHRNGYGKLPDLDGAPCD